MLANAILFTIGAASHWGYFRRGEHHMHVITYLQTFLLLLATASIFVSVMYDEPWDQAVRFVLSLGSSYLAGLYTSLTLYRVFLSPLKEFPGPFAASISNLWLSSRLINVDGHKKVLDLHRRYGDIVRIGSSDLSIALPKAVNAIYGLGSKCTKADWYDLTLPMVSMQTTRSRVVHDKQRRVWSTAFSDKALRGYEERIKGHQERLFSRFRASSGESINATKWFSLYGFDVMGDLAFGTSFNMLKTSQEHWAIKTFNEGVHPLGWMLPTWLFRVLTAIPFASAGWWRFINYCNQRLEERMNTKVDTPDIMSALLDQYKDNPPTGADLRILRGDSQLIVVAGSDTTASTLTNTLYELLRNPSQISRLRDEIARHTSNGSDLSHLKLQYLPHLNGIIYETLRLHPPVGTALHRKTPPEGIVIDGTYIPGDTTVLCPQYVMGRSESAYKEPLKFHPERWYAEPEMIYERSSFAPFSAGIYGCIGKPLALMNIRTTIAQLIMGFDLEFAPGEDGTNLERQEKSHFTIDPGEMLVVFKERA